GGGTVGKDESPARNLDDVTSERSVTPQAGDRFRRERRRRAAARRRRRRGLLRLAVLILAVGLLILVISQLGSGISVRGGSSPSASSSRQAGKVVVPSLLDPHDVYAADRPGRLAPAVRKFPSRVYVPNSESGTVSVINPNTYKVVDQFPVGDNPQHVVPSYDLKTLWVNNDLGNSLTAVNPATGRPGRTV